MEWRLYINKIQGKAYIPFPLTQEGMEEAKQELHQIRLDGGNGFIYRGEMKCQ